MLQGEDVLYCLPGTYQRFTKAGVCSCHSIKEKTGTDAVIAKIQEVCEGLFGSSQVAAHCYCYCGRGAQSRGHDSEIQSLHSKIDGLTINLDKMHGSAGQVCC